MILMGEVIEKLESMDERLRIDQRCRNIKQEWYENKQILSYMLRDASKNNFIELLVTVNTTPQPHQRFPENPDINELRHEIKDVLLKLAIKAEQMSEDLSQLMNDAVRKVTLEDMMKMMTEMMKMNHTDQKEMMNVAAQSLQSLYEKSIAESHHIDISTDGYIDCHSNMSIDGHIKDVAEVDKQVQLKSQQYSKMQLKHLLLQLTWLMMKQHSQQHQVKIFAHKMRLQGLLMICLTIQMHLMMLKLS